MDKLPKELLDLTQYPEVMYMDMYGNGSQHWDRRTEKSDLFDLVFKAKYIRADLVAEKIQEARHQGYETALQQTKEKDNG